MNKLLLLLKGQLALLFSSRKTDKNIWVFSSRNNEDFNYNSKYLFLYVKENCKHIKPLYVVNDEEKRTHLQALYGEEYFIETNSYAGMKKALQAGVWLTSAGMPVYALGIGKRRTIINLWHGIPLKKIALLEENVNFLRKLYFRKIFSENYSYVLTSASGLIPIMAQSFDVSEDRIKVWGQPRNDALLDVSQHTQKIDDFVDVVQYDKVILYAPTYRDNRITRWFPFEDFSMDALQAFLKDNRILLCLRAHAQEEGLEDLCKAENIVNLGPAVVDDVTEYLYMFDMLITDYSSIYIDYMLLNRPMLFLPYDKEEYLEERGFNFVYDAVTPGAKPESFKGFCEAILTELGEDSYAEDRKHCNAYFNEIVTPCSADICDRIFDMENP